MSKYSGHDHYIDPEYGVLKNKLGLKTEAALEQQEADFAAARSYQLSQLLIDDRFDFNHLKAIHRHLFSDIYEWAGEPRDVDITKGQTRFAHHVHIESAASHIFKQLAEENFGGGLDLDGFSKRAAHYFADINALHPFRDGNGRVQREFITQLARKNGYWIEWKNINQEAMLNASVESYHGNIKGLVELIRSNLKMIQP